MMFAPTIQEEVERAIGPFEPLGSVGGGSVSRAVRVRTRDRDYLLKSRPSEGAIFRSEAEGLEALRAVESGLRVPAVAAVSGVDEAGWIVLEWIDSGPQTADGARALGAGIARLHRSTARPGDWGWPSDNFIGPLPQENGAEEPWARYWARRRIEPQLRRAVDGGHRPGSPAAWERLLGALDELLAPAEEEGASLLHGDLWRGNVLEDTEGRPVVIDPAVFRGHREVDLAMMRLFGGFPDATFEAYGEDWPIREGFERRCAAYQLYYLLVHVNLFGGGYISRTTDALHRALEG